MHPLLRPTNIVIAVLGAAVVGLGTAVIVEHNAGTLVSAPNIPPSPSLAAVSTAANSLLLSSGFAASGQVTDEASRVFDFFTTDTKLTWQQIGADVLRGETLDQIAGKVEADALAEVKAGLELGVVKGVITPAQDARLVNDAQDAISVLMGAKLSALLPTGR
jgi:hypothetical protein